MSPYIVTLRQIREITLKIHKAEDVDHAVELATDFVQHPVPGHGVDVLHDQQLGQVQIVVSKGDLN